ncbi:hypothetical protein N7504_004531 [Penicillium tannophilum]|nr:hypothetical protein N7504_004531 [Penicillium tannophilum]
MALTITVNDLVSLGVSITDVANLAGAGRAVGTWVMNSFKDQGLLQFMKLDPEDLVPRKGLLDPVALHEKWDSQLTLLVNGDRRLIGDHSRPVVGNMGTFSWFMVLIISAMDATLQTSSMKKAARKFLTALFEEHVDELDYLQRELPQHIQGWVSAAVVRGTISRARVEWQNLLNCGRRLPGSIPDKDVPEIVRLLVWLAGAKGQRESKSFRTTSSDVFAFATILQSVGLDIIETVNETQDEMAVLESRLAVKFDPYSFAYAATNKLYTQHDIDSQTQRLGMRIPLIRMEECVSVWPETASENNYRRMLFREGHAASQTLSISTQHMTSGRTIPEWQAFLLCDETKGDVGRLDGLLNRMVYEFFPIPNPSIIDGISGILKHSPDLMDRAGVGIFRHLEENSDLLGKIQVYVLGYYYGMLRKVLNVSKLSTPEAYANWQWFDTRLLTWIKMVLSDYCKENGKTRVLSRTGMLMLLGRLFAGAEEDQLRALDNSAIGIHGKISVVSTSLMGATRSKDAATCFCLLDTDSTAIPSNARGIVKSGVQDMTFKRPSMLQENHLCEIKNPVILGTAEDLTSHIEPDWENDIQQCQVVYRYKGRIVGRMAPLTMENAWTNLAAAKSLPSSESNLPTKVYVAEISNLVENIPQADFGSAEFQANQPSILFQTNGLIKAKSFLLAHFNLTGFSRIELQYPWPEMGWDPKRDRDDADSPIFLCSNIDHHDLQASWTSGRCIILA